MGGERERGRGGRGREGGGGGEGEGEREGGERGREGRERGREGRERGREGRECNDALGGCKLPETQAVCDVMYLVWPAKYGEGEKGRGEPSVQHILV